MIKTICIQCTRGHNYRGKFLPKNIRWCCRYGKLVKDKRNCIDFNRMENTEREKKERKAYRVQQRIRSKKL